MTARPDGARSLTGHDGFVVTVEPTLYQDITPEVIAEIDAAVPPEAVVRMPARAPDRIPRPRPSEPAPEQTGGDRPRHPWGWTVGVWLIGATAAAWSVITAMVLAVEFTDPRVEWDVVLAVLIPEVPLVWTTWALAKGRRARRR
ncbi:hypothetical protein [Streptomyces sp. NPDC002588]|uniref:hypothetical protein n=1 Tax=Streptomyces sp. NPDC002588 TaxID=3154419 RepID=UPI003322F318